VLGGALARPLRCGDMAPAEREHLLIGT